jgi:hypothetical protein
MTLHRCDLADDSCDDAFVKVFDQARFFALMSRGEMQ